MNEVNFYKWMNALKNAWETKDPQAAADLCAAKLNYFETPFSNPFKTRKEVLKEWKSVLKQKNIKFDFSILLTNEDFGIAHWNAEFIRIPGNEKVNLDGIFKVHLSKNGLCKEFYQWYNQK